jgi:hypothetical protein
MWDAGYNRSSDLDHQTIAMNGVERRIFPITAFSRDGPLTELNPLRTGGS